MVQDMTLDADPGAYRDTPSFLAPSTGAGGREHAVVPAAFGTAEMANDRCVSRPASSAREARGGGKMAHTVGQAEEDREAELRTQLLTLYKWLDALPLPSIKRSSGSVARDFSDATAVADIIHFYFPSYVEQHNYVKTSNTSRKKANWEVLMTKVLLKRMEFKAAFGRYANGKCRETVIAALCAGVTGPDGRNRDLEDFLWRLMGCCTVDGQVKSSVQTCEGGRRLGSAGSEGLAGSEGSEGLAGSEELAGSEGLAGCSDLARGDAGRRPRETGASTIQALMEENTKLSTMLLKQDGIIRMMQAKIDALEAAVSGRT